ncbi:hypothetical protein [Aureliella helgolandensis]|uniref:Secreted protein n=1 Tax=Aureliella helgolandensis TaxID=2527968 RepID=A0A518G187_9BACT|nr:hypothetical protein [Aureliella helgolandensis]QDV22362.1 hypothetical protein Q31a_06460 [Aureliella helgolandensis]
MRRIFATGLILASLVLGTLAVSASAADRHHGHSSHYGYGQSYGQGHGHQHGHHHSSRRYSSGYSSYRAHPPVYSQAPIRYYGGYAPPVYNVYPSSRYNSGHNHLFHLDVGRVHLGIGR